MPRAGWLGIMEVENYPALNVLPIVLVGDTLKEESIPTTIPYDLFLSFPQDIEGFADRVNELAETVKTRRKISRYVCPVCHSRLTCTRETAPDLFCPRCHTAVTLVDDEDCLYMPIGTGLQLPCQVAQITPHVVPHAERPIDRRP